MPSRAATIPELVVANVRRSANRKFQPVMPIAEKPENNAEPRGDDS
jgi:hypothetical protein